MNNSLLNGLDFSPETNFSRYLKKIGSIPMMTPEEEIDLTTRYIKKQDQKIAYRIISSHLRLVAKIAFGFKGYKLPLGEVISEGNLGLINALAKFDPSKGFRFSTYAIWWIRAYIQKYVLNSWSLVKIGTTAAQKKLFFNLRKAKEELELMDDRNMNDKILQELANVLNVSVKEVKDMNQRMSGRDGSLNVAIDSSEESGKELMDFIADKKPNQEEVYSRQQVLRERKKLFNEALKVLNERERDILQKRRLEQIPMTLDDLSKIYDISKERVRQIEVSAIEKIQKEIGLIIQ